MEEYEGNPDVETETIILPIRFFSHFECHCYPVVTQYHRET